MFVETGELADIDADLAAAFAGQRNGLCGAAVPGRLWLITGRHTGTVSSPSRCTYRTTGRGEVQGGR